MSEIFAFEFHSITPLLECRNIKQTFQVPTLKIYGRTANNKSVCANVTGHLPYFYLFSDIDDERIVLQPLRDTVKLTEIGISIESFKISTTEKIPFYNYYEGYSVFYKIECCSESVRRRLINFVKDSPELGISLYEAHISFAMQFMSNHSIVGMGLVNVDSPRFLDKVDKSSTCDVECIFGPEKILNRHLINESQKKSLLPSLSLFLDNLGVATSSMQAVNASISSANSLDNITGAELFWPKIDFAVDSKLKLKCPTFKSYIFRDDPPIDVIDYYPLEIQKDKYPPVTGFSPSKRKIAYVPAFDPPEFAFKDRIHSFSFEEHVDQLTLTHTSKSSFPLYDYNGDYYLKFMILECYETGKGDMPPISTMTLTVLSGSSTLNYLFTTDRACKSIKNDAGFLFFGTELDMLREVIRLCVVHDPDILVGFEIDSNSWGYAAKRYDFLIKEAGHIEFSFQAELSRIIKKDRVAYMPDPWISRSSSQFQVVGRMCFNLWRIFRDEIPLRVYSISEICKFYFNRNIRMLSRNEICELANSNFLEFKHYVTEILEFIGSLVLNTNFLTKAIEFSRLFGIDLFSTLTRGSQYRVESILITAAHAEDYLLKTPTEIEIRQMRAAEGLPLTMEPISNYYRDPIVVLDFQSLYPSIIIANNFCYSTIVGKVENDLVESCGAVTIPTAKMYNWHSFSKLSDYPTYNSPGNILFVRKEHKIGLLPRLLNEILTTRVAIKNAMKTCDSKIKNVLDARQLALKYISNVTYGYTSASFSGRMPNVDIADAIVLSGRKTLERAIETIESNPKWQAKVVYGDTDSLFVLLPGRSLSVAHLAGQEMAKYISSLVPSPMALKFEKVYLPSLLMSKKRYCGLKFENIGSEPVFDAKGIETVRRDGCPLSAKILEKSLMILFKHDNIDMVREYVQRQIVKILTYQKLNIADFVFAREVKFGTYKSDSDNRLPLSAIAAKKRGSRCQRLSVSYGERVAFVIVAKPFSKLYQKVVDLEEFIRSDNRLDVVYYATAQILTVLARPFTIQGIDVWRWYNELPLGQIKNTYGLKSINFSTSNPESYMVEGNFSRKIQSALRVQDLIINRNSLMRTRDDCCCSHMCSNYSCENFWSLFSFNHIFSRELDEKAGIFGINL